MTGTLFLQTWHYASPELRAKLFYLADPVTAVEFSGSNTIDHGYLALRDWISIPVEDYAVFVSAHPSFTLYTQGELEWLSQKLSADGATLTEVGREETSRIYDVRWEGESHLTSVGPPGSPAR